MNHSNEQLNGNYTIDLDSLISRMQTEDSRNKRMMKSIFYIYLVGTVFYALLFVLNPDPELTFYDRAGGLCYVLAFLTGTFFFRREYKELKNTDYTVPLMQLLTLQEARYRFMGRKWLVILVILVLIAGGLGFSLMNPNRLMQFTPLEKLVIIQGVYWSIIVAAGIVGYILWKKRSYPIWKDVKTLREELIH